MKKIYNTILFPKGKAKTIFTITGIEGFDLRKDAHRCFGWSSKLGRAAQAVLNNECDIYECSHTYVLIEEIKEGTFGLSRREWWFKWSDKKRAYFSIPKPEETKGIINWSI